MRSCVALIIYILRMGNKKLVLSVYLDVDDIAGNLWERQTDKQIEN